jgi:hypothetical protein
VYLYKLGALVQFFGAQVDLTSVEIAQVEAVEEVCLLKDTLPRSILISQVHLLVYIIQGMVICGLALRRWMFFLEHFTKTLKDFVRQNAQLDRSMTEGWLIQGVVFIS